MSDDAEVSIREAAALVGRPVGTVRYWVATRAVPVCRWWRREARVRVGDVRARAAALAPAPRAQVPPAERPMKRDHTRERPMPRVAAPLPEPKLGPGEVEALVRQYEPLCWHLAQRHGAGLCEADVEELAAVARLRLVRSARTFDPARGWKFMTYAYRLCLNEVRYAARKIRAGGLTLPTDHRVPVPGRVGLDAPAGAGGATAADLTAGRAGPDPGAGEAWDWCRRHLTAREFEALALLYRDGLRLHEAGARLGVSKERARQIREAALAKLRAAGAAEHLGDAA